MSLAEALINDFEDADDVDINEEQEQGMEVDNPFKTPLPVVDTYQQQSLRSIAKLYDSPELKNIMEEIQQKHVETHLDVQETSATDPHYHLIVAANNLAAQIDDDITIIFKFTKEKYCKRFPELESLIPTALDYMYTVKELGNHLDRAKNNSILLQFLTPATLMVVSVTASTTQGQMLTPKELEVIIEACNMATELNTFKSQILAYVESRMCYIAPNLSALVGSSIAAKLMGQAGGLLNLSRIPSCNILLLGNKKKALSGFSYSTIMRQTGYILSCDLVENTPADSKKKIARFIANKCVLAARADATHSYRDGSYGGELREETEKKLDKLQEPPPVKMVKPLIAPIDQPKKKRGGRRVRKMKEHYATTELRRQANRMLFAEIEDDAYQEDLGLSTGLIKKGNTGRIRTAQVDEKTKVRISKTLQRQQQVWGGSTSVKKQISGTASSVAFTPLQGLEIVNPQAAEKKGSDNNNKYFSSTTGFFNVQ